MPPPEPCQPKHQHTALKEYMKLDSEHRSFHQGARQAAAAACSFPAAYLTGIGLRIYDSGAQAQKRFADLGVAPYSQCSQGSGER